MWANLTSKARLKLGHATGQWHQTQQQIYSDTVRKEKNQDVAAALSKPGPQSDIKAMAGAVCKFISNWAMWETHKMIYFQAAASKCCCTSYWIMLSFSQHCMLVVFFVAVQRAAWNLIKWHKFDWMWICVRQMCRHSPFSDEKYQSHLFPLSFEPPASSAAAGFLRCSFTLFTHWRAS